MKLLIAATCIFLGLPTSAWSVCRVFTSDGSDYYIANASGFKPPSFDPGKTAIGGVIYGAYVNAVFSNTKSSAGGASVACNPAVYYVRTGVGSQINNIYPTSIPNIGIRITNVGTSNRVIPYTAGPIGSATWSSATFLDNARYLIQLIKTGDISAGGTLTGSFMQTRVGTVDGQILIDFRFASPVVVQPQVPTCKVATPNVAVPMGAVFASSFKSVGTTSTPHAFDIALTCSGGNAGTSTNAYVTLTDATAPGNTSTTLSLSNDSTASGIGVQILKNGSPLGFGPDSTAVGNTNQWYAGRVAQGQVSLTVPLSARYVQTGATVKPGSANARATFTLSYQ
ncbi:fimbrial protein [Burkholderia sp. Tr-20390]|uniref:fimbrial protein n=1 Tax=Burkholderia sp. Tr-20390 TaxID=2703904 RepID=UPI00197DD321|nr:fimbrial protein [Burkholderia sp. Tr-20390]MBN3734948.1 fimbrial protein [Burkholderia sp. Tr-20390]